MAQTIELRINGSARQARVSAETSLLHVLREQIGLTGTKYGCGEGQCGACTVLIDGKARRSCLTPAASVTGRSITTIEGLEKDGRLHPVQQAFLEDGALQCGYCTPGMILTAVALLRANPHPTRAEIRRAMEGNICRCGVYGRILDAIHNAAHEMKRA